MGLFSRKKKRMNLGKYRHPAPRPVPSLESQVQEGLLIVTAGVRMAVKNQSILWALRDRADFDLERYRVAVRAHLLDAADELDLDAQRAAAAMTRSERSGFGSSSDHEESERLHRKQEMLFGVAERLRELVDDDDYVETFALAARDAAWEDIGAAVKESALLSDPQPRKVSPTERNAALARVRLALNDLRLERES